MSRRPAAIGLRVRLPTRLWPSGAIWLAACPALDVVTQAETALAAQAALQEAVELWFASCLERGVLPQALAECGFAPGGSPRRPSAPPPVPAPAGSRSGLLDLTLPAWRR